MPIREIGSRRSWLWGLEKDAKSTPGQVVGMCLWQHPGAGSSRLVEMAKGTTGTPLDVWVISIVFWER